MCVCVYVYIYIIYIYTYIYIMSLLGHVRARALGRSVRPISKLARPKKA